MNNRRKYNEKMIVRNGKMIYAISLDDKNENNSGRTHILIENGKVYFSDNWYSNSVEFNFNEEAHKIAKEIFVSQLQVDIKRRVLELKQLEEIFTDLNLKECFGNALTDNTKRLLELENKIDEIKVDVDKEVKKVKKDTLKIVDNAIEEQVRPIARKKTKGDK